jgi:uncharacterized protein (DUF697 family)
MVMTEKQQKAVNTVKRYMWWSMGAGLVPVPVLDLLAVSGVQFKMLAELSKQYGIPFKESRGKAVIGSLVGFVLPHSMSVFLFGTLAKAAPGVGSVAGASAMVVTAGACAWALGNVFIQHFESGGTFLDFDPEAVKEYFKAQFEEGKKVAATLKPEGEVEAKA